MSLCSPTRAESVATFYGVMARNGNVWEHAVTIANSDGPAFTGTHGDGELATNGDADCTAVAYVVSHANDQEVLVQ